MVRFRTGFFAYVISFLIIAATPLNSKAIEVQQIYHPEQHQPALRLQRAFLNDFTDAPLFKSDGRIYLSYGQKIQFSSKIYSVRKYNFLPSFASSLEFHKRQSITDFGMIGTIKWPLLQRESWSIDFNGTLSGAQQYSGPSHQKNRWDFEHQIGWDANYHIADDLRASVGVYQYRIISNLQYSNPAGSYINSSGGFASLRLQF